MELQGSSFMEEEEGISMREEIPLGAPPSSSKAKFHSQKNLPFSSPTLLLYRGVRRWGSLVIYMGSGMVVNSKGGLCPYSILLGKDKVEPLNGFHT